MLLKWVGEILKGLLDEGTEQDIFHTEYETEAIEMLLLYANTMFDYLAE